MAKGKYQKWLTKPKLAVLTNWARLGLSEPQIAHNMGIAYSTFKVWKGKYPAISAAVGEGKEVVDAVVINALLQSAKAGSVQAQIFWLRNRLPEYFRDGSYSELNKAQAEKAKEDARKAKAEADIAEAKAKAYAPADGEHNGLNAILSAIDGSIENDDND